MRRQRSKQETHNTMNINIVIMIIIVEVFNFLMFTLHHDNDNCLDTNNYVYI